MKKRFYLAFALGTCALALASCNNGDDVEFNLKEPQKDSKATEVYTGEDYYKIFGIVSYSRNDENNPFKKAYEEFENNYKAVTVKAKIEEERADGSKSMMFAKTIIDLETFNLYSSEYSYTLEGGKKTNECKVVSNAVTIAGENDELTYRVNTEITLNDFSYMDSIEMVDVDGFEFEKVNFKKANGSVKLTADVSESNSSDAISFLNIFVRLLPSARLGSTGVITSTPHTVYATKDKDYLYSTYEDKYRKEIFVDKDYMFSYCKQIYQSIVFEQQHEYSKKSLLGTSLDTNGYKEYDYLSLTDEPLKLPFVNTVYSNGISSKDLISGNRNFIVANFTVSEA